MTEKICRLCLCQPIVSYSLLDENGSEMLEALTSLKVAEDDGVPKSACIKCWLNLKLAYNIQQGFLEANRKLQLIEFTTSDDETSIKKESDDFETLLNDVKSDLQLQNTDKDVIVIKGEISDEAAVYDNSIDEQMEEEPLPEPNEKQVETADSQFSCVICGDFLSELSIESHVKEHFCNEQYCDECDLKFDNLQSYKLHIVSHHDADFKTWQCSKCEASFQYKSLYNIHRQRAHLDRTKKGILVEGAPKQKEKSIEDVFEEESTNGIFRCPECSKTFTEKEKRMFESHMKVHRRKKCHICNAMITISNIKKHITSHSAGPSVCHLCGVTCKNYDSLRGHLYYTHSTNSFPCEHCGKIFKKSYSRLLHVRKEHTGEKSHICDTCGKGFFTHYCLNKHIRMTHMKLRPYICEHCHKGFSSKFALRTHVRQHTNDAPYKCDLCGEGFRQNVSLRVHKKNKHDIVEEKNSECKICGKMFVSNWAVQSHMRLH